MDNILVIVFDTEAQAYEGSKALLELQSDNSISLYSKAIVARDSNGKVMVKQQSEIGPLGTAVGLMIGSLVGMSGGPVGLAIGAGVGTLGGLVYDLSVHEASKDFLIEAEKFLQIGKAAVVAEVFEERTLPIDTRMASLGGVIFRRLRRDVLDDQVEKDIAELNAEVIEMEAERGHEIGEDWSKHRAKVEAAQARLQAAQVNIQARIHATKNETEAKIKVLQEQATRDRKERKAKREAHIAGLKAD